MSQQEQIIFSRREALKSLAAVTGAISLAGLPSHWETPIVVVGVVPAHAQISSGSLFKVDDRFVSATICAPHLQWQATIAYNVPAGGESFQFEIQFSGGTGGNAVLLFIDGDDGPFQGELTLTFCLDFGTHNQATLDLWGLDTNGLTTNHLVYFLARPAPVSQPEDGRSQVERIGGTAPFP